MVAKRKSCDCGWNVEYNYFDYIKSSYCFIPCHQLLKISWYFYQLNHIDICFFISYSFYIFILARCVNTSNVLASIASSFIWFLFPENFQRKSRRTWTGSHMLMKFPRKREEVKVFKHSRNVLSNVSNVTILVLLIILALVP